MRCEHDWCCGDCYQAADKTPSIREAERHHEVLEEEEKYTPARTPALEAAVAAIEKKLAEQKEEGNA